MIRYVPGYFGLDNVRNCVLGKIGTDGLERFANLHIIGRRYESPITIGHNNPSNAFLRVFLENKTRLPVGVENDAAIPYTFWLSFNRNLRVDNPNICASVIAFVYSNLNGLVRWLQVAQPQAVQAANNLNNLQINWR